MSAYAGPEIVTKGLVLNLDAANPKSYPGSGNNWYSVANTSFTAIKEGSQSPTYPEWNSSGYFTFSGGVIANNYSRFYVNNIPSFSSLSVFAWSRPTTYDYRSILRMVNSDFELTFGSTTSFFVSAGLNYDDIGITFNQSKISDGNWHNYGLTFDGQTLLSYFDSINQNSAFRSTPAATASGTLHIGTRNDAYAAHYTGDISIIQIYSRVLNTEEVLQNFNALRGRFNI